VAAVRLAARRTKRSPLGALWGNLGSLAPVMSWEWLGELAHGKITQIFAAGDAAAAAAGGPAAAAEEFLRRNLWPALQLQGWCMAEGPMDLQLLRGAFPSLENAQLVQQLGALGASFLVAPPQSSLFGEVIASLTAAVQLLVGRGVVAESVPAATVSMVRMEQGAWIFAEWMAAQVAAVGRGAAPPQQKQQDGHRTRLPATNVPAPSMSAAPAAKPAAPPQPAAANKAPAGGEMPAASGGAAANARQPMEGSPPSQVPVPLTPSPVRSPVVISGPPSRHVSTSGGSRGKPDYIAMLADAAAVVEGAAGGWGMGEVEWRAASEAPRGPRKQARAPAAKKAAGSLKRQRQAAQDDDSYYNPAEDRVATAAAAGSRSPPRPQQQPPQQPTQQPPQQQQQQQPPQQQAQQQQQAGGMEWEAHSAPAPDHQQLPAATCASSPSPAAPASGRKKRSPGRKPRRTQWGAGLL